LWRGAENPKNASDDCTRGYEKSDSATPQRSDICIALTC
jgi:hypothetical protein